MCTWHPLLWLKEGERYWNKENLLNVTRLVSSSATSQVGISNEISWGFWREATIGTAQSAGLGSTSFWILNLPQLSIAFWHQIKTKIKERVLILNFKYFAAFFYDNFLQDADPEAIKPWHLLFCSELCFAFLLCITVIHDLKIDLVKRQ